jgi:membrane associated rhomboid family serine protease
MIIIPWSEDGLSFRRHVGTWILASMFVCVSIRQLCFHTELWVVSASNLSLSQAIKAMLSHANWLHFAANFIFLIALGSVFEKRIGSILFLSIFFISGVVALFCYYDLLMQPFPSVGASGGLSGLLGAYLVLYWSQPSKFAYLLPIPMKRMAGFFFAPTWLMAVLFIFVDLSMLPYELSGRSSVGHSVHLLGAFFGAATTLMLKKLNLIKTDAIVKPSNTYRMAVEEENSRPDVRSTGLLFVSSGILVFICAEIQSTSIFGVLLASASVISFICAGYLLCKHTLLRLFVVTDSKTAK